MLPVFMRPRRGRPPSRQQLPPRPTSCLRYQLVGSVVDSGPNARTAAEARRRLRHYFRVQNDEIFRRIEVDVLVSLVVDSQHLLHDLVDDQEEVGSPRRLPYLLLDVREAATYSARRLVTARHFSPSRLSHAVRPDTEEMRWYRRREDAVLIVYDDNEQQQARRCVTELTQRGYDNVFMLSGGLKLVADYFPQLVVTDAATDRLSRDQLQLLEQQLGSFQTGQLQPPPSVGGSWSQGGSALTLASSSSTLTRR